jgi:hypothetical protein
LDDPGLDDPGLDDPGLDDPGLDDPGLDDLLWAIRWGGSGVVWWRGAHFKKIEILIL